MIYFKSPLVLQLNIILYYCVKFFFCFYFPHLAVNPFNDFYSVLCLKATYSWLIGAGGVAVHSCL